MSPKANLKDFRPRSKSMYWDVYTNNAKVNKIKDENKGEDFAFDDVKNALTNIKKEESRKSMKWMMDDPMKRMDSNDTNVSARSELSPTGLKRAMTMRPELRNVLNDEDEQDVH